MPKHGRTSPRVNDNYNALYSPYGTEFTPVLDTRIVGGRLVHIRARPDPVLQPSKPIANLQAQDEAKYRKVPRGRYDTTYRREYLNFGNFKAFPNEQGTDPLEKYAINNPNAGNAPTQQALNPYPLLPPINSPQNQAYQSHSIDHIVNDDAYNYNKQLNSLPPPNQEPLSSDKNNDNYLPVDPIYLSPQEEANLINDVTRELEGYPSANLKNFYAEMLSYDPTATGFAHHMYITLVAMRNQLPLSESLMRFLMSRFVSSNQQRGYVNYEELVKFFAKCLGEVNKKMYSPRPQNQIYEHPSANQTNLSPRMVEKYDPDEQAILRLMHENMRDWDQVNLIDTDNLRKKFYEIDPYNRYILTQREIEDVVYKNRIPIQRSLIFQILERYCKVAVSQYKWPAFVDFLEKTKMLKLPNKKKTHYTLREGEKEADISQFTYRQNQLESLKNLASEEERLGEISKQIYNLQNLKNETKQKLESRLENVVKGETWFTRFMRLANAMYNHRINAGIEFALPKDEARRLITAYNTVYDLNIPEALIEDGLAINTVKGNVVIDNLIKFLAKVN
ncbi:hypothetical protein BpHYR1_016564 [Brachionus plicatilis]|uniref:Uncharacterized protein n=1 Tax=Brachionus plicatilis TaxID=10195 RepID=A0A3M7QM16_BRAPC|nr:hypothetical protein BpHYR1_016564 [Brachionus plicatilis]